MVKETKKFSAEVGKVLQLVIHSLYTNRDIFLRELISNASDACDKLRYASINDNSIGVDSKSLLIKVEVDKNKNQLIISDNGIGMNKEDMELNLGTIASSGTQRFMEQIKNASSPSDVQLIGQFGVGFYSAFMIAEKVDVLSKKHGESQAYIWESKGDGEYSISEAEYSEYGTRIILHLKQSEVEYLEKYRIKHIIKTYSDHISFPIEFADEDGKKEVVNSASAIWTRSKSEITNEQYLDFYHHVSHSPDEPWMTLHNKTEGNVEYTSLLFIPSQKPFDLFHPDRKNRVKLYVKKVFITEDNANLIPAYMRFLRGVVDSEDLLLNISRETLQNNQIIFKIKKSIIKRVLGALKAKAESDAESYKGFWNTFGEVMKEGLCEGALEEKEQLLEICRFQCSENDDLISLDQYLDAMLDGQDQIFFIAGDKLENLKNNPQLEGFKKRGINVLLLTDHVDDFWVNVVNQYKNKELYSINRTGIDLDAIKRIEFSKEEEKSESQADKQNVVDFFSKVLADKVREVKASNKLVDSPACLSIPEGGMNIRMERYLIEQKQLFKKSSKILEINLDHPLIKNICAKITSSDLTSAEEMVGFIFDHACILAGENISDPYTYTKRINEILLHFSKVA
jgi:molecular chaperone HtpG